MRLLSLLLVVLLPLTINAQQKADNTTAKTDHCLIRMKTFMCDPVQWEKEFDSNALLAAKEGRPIRDIVIENGVVHRVGKRPTLRDEAHLTRNPYFLLQFVGPTRQEWKDTLEKAGTTFLRYIPDNTFIVKMDSKALKVAQDDGNVRWIGPYDKKYKHTLDVSSVGNDGNPSNVGDGNHNSVPVNTPNAKERFVVLLFKDGDAVAFKKAVASAGGRILAASDGPYNVTLNVELDRAALTTISHLSSVEWIEKYQEVKDCNSVAASDDACAVKVVWDTWGLHGEGQTIGVCDGGLDRGSTSTELLNDDFEDGSGASRVVQIIDTAGDGDVSDPTGHGTHVAGSILGNGKNSGANPSANDFPNTCYAGMAPKAKCKFQANQNIVGSAVFPPDLNSLFQVSHEQFPYYANLHSDSWGVGVGGDYTVMSLNVDQYMWAHKDFLILFAAGNEGRDADSSGRIDFGYEGVFPSSLLAPGTAKNCLTVGASESLRTPAFLSANGGLCTSSWFAHWGASVAPVNPIRSDLISDRLDGVCAFSSRGPCLDGRTKPDLVAPGSNIASVRAYGRSSSGGDTPDGFYSWKSGTSMATPLVAGMAAIVRQFFTEGRYPGITVPSAALIKAVLLNGAVNMAPGQYGVATGKQEIPNVRPNNVAGWGRANLNQSLFRSGGKGLRILGTDVTTADAIGTGDVRSYQINVKQGTPLLAHLVWTDAPGAPQAGGGLVNDLDLVVVDPDGVMNYPSYARYSKSVCEQYATASSGNRSIVYTGFQGIKCTPTTLRTLDRVRFKLSSSGTGTRTQKARVYDDDGPGGLPGTLLREQSFQFQASIMIVNVWVDLPDLYVESGHSVYVGVANDTVTDINIRTDTGTYGHSWQLQNGTWSLIPDGENHVVAVFSDGNAGPSTVDRVNNVEGVEIPTPKTGTYTIRVTGYAVSQGDPSYGNRQPFSVVVSGDFPEMSKQAVWGF